MSSRLSRDNFNLTMLNFWIGLCEGKDRSLPKGVAELGYKVRWVEPSFEIPVVPSTKNVSAKQSEPNLAKTVNPEIIISSAEHKHAVVFEFKSGKNIEPLQLQRYMLLTASDIAANILYGKPETHDVLYMALALHRDSILRGMNEANAKFPVVFVQHSGMVIGSESCANKDFNACLGNGAEVPINWDEVPRYFAIDSHSSPVDVAHSVLTGVALAITKNLAHIDLEDILRQVCLWGLVHPKGKTSLRTIVKKLLERMVKSPHLSDFFELDASKQILVIKDGAIKLLSNARLQKFIQSLTKEPLTFQQVLLDVDAHLTNTTGKPAENVLQTNGVLPCQDTNSNVPELPTPEQN